LETSSGQKKRLPEGQPGHQGKSRKGINFSGQDLGTIDKLWLQSTI